MEESGRHRPDEYVVDPSLCTSCGVCAGLCPVNAITMLPTGTGGLCARVDHHTCTACGICLEICPPRQWCISDTSLKGLLGFDAEQVRYEPGIGYYRACSIAYAADSIIHKGGASGGITTAVLKYLFEAGEIDSALVTMMSDADPFATDTRIVTSTEHILTAQKSKYQLSTFDKALQEFSKRRDLQHLAVVGLPCHIQAIRQAEAKYPGIGRKIAFTISLFCGHNVTRDFLSFHARRAGISPSDVISVGFRQGEWWDFNYIELDTADGRKIEFPFRRDNIRNIWKACLFAPYGCLVCPDLVGESADMSVGDAWLAELKANMDGMSLVIIRSKRGEQLYGNMLGEGLVVAEQTNPDIVIKSQAAQVRFKKQSIAGRLGLLRLLGRPIPVGTPLRPTLRWTAGAIMLYAGSWLGLILFRLGLLHRFPRKVFGIYAAILGQLT